MAKIKIDLSEHSNPESLVESARHKFPDKNVEFSLDGASMVVKISEKVPTQIAVNIHSRILRFCKEDLYPQHAT